MVGVKASNGNHGQSGGPGRGLWRDDGERAPHGGPAEAGAAAINEHDNGERAQPGGSAEVGAAATGVLDKGAPPGGPAEIGAAAATKGRDDGEPAAQPRPGRGTR